MPSDHTPEAENDYIESAARLLEWASGRITVDPRSGCPSCVNNAEASAESHLRLLASDVRTGLVFPPGATS